MQCQLVGAGVRVLSAAVTLVSGIGKEVLLEAGPDGLILRALNDGRSTFCEARLQAGLFAQYSAPPAGGPASLKVKLLARPLRGVFKALRGCESVRLYFASAGGAGATDICSTRADGAAAGAASPAASAAPSAA